MPSSDTFISITNREIYDELKTVHSKVDDIITINKAMTTNCNKRFCNIEDRLERHSKKLLILFVLIGPAAIGAAAAIV